MKLIALLGALFCVLGGTFCETVRYKCSQRELDKLDSSFARIMSVSKYQRKIPETFSQLSAYCKYFLVSICWLQVFTIMSLLCGFVFQCNKTWFQVYGRSTEEVSNWLGKATWLSVYVFSQKCPQTELSSQESESCWVTVSNIKMPQFGNQGYGHLHGKDDQRHTERQTGRTEESNWLCLLFLLRVSIMRRW